MFWTALSPSLYKSRRYPLQEEKFPKQIATIMTQNITDFPFPNFVVFNHAYPVHFTELMITKLSNGVRKIIHTEHENGKKP